MGKLLANKKIAIVGGGPGGLTLARLLQMSGADVKVYERDYNKEVRVQGATLDLHDDSGLKALRKAGLIDAFKENYRPGADRMRIADKNAAIFLDQHTEEWKEEFGSVHFRPEIDRGPLRNILLQSLQPGTLVWDSQFVTMQQADSGWKLEFKNGTTATADIVIGADGANSKIRPFVTPLKPFYSGVTALEGTVYNSETTTPKIHELLKDGKIFAFSDAKILVVSSKDGGSLAFYPSFKTDEHWVKNSGIDFSNSAEVFTWFKQEFSGWDSIWHELFENAQPNFIPRPIYCMPLDQTWDALPNLTILGDAAHVMPPFAGEGVNMAMLDALELSECLTHDNFEDIQEAIAAYEKQMRKRGSEAAKESLENGDWMHTENALNRMLDFFGERPKNE
jgi:2-polyprenyl-6-methoxyphenol hydroxylase-like FAD-dependent oxidoreductase